MLENSLIRKPRLILKFITSQPGKKTMTIHILPNIWNSEGNQTMKFGQYNMRNIFLENWYTMCGEKTSSMSSSKTSKLNILLSQQPKVLYSLFLFYVHVEGYRKILKLRCRPLAFSSYKAFSKNKKRPGTSLSASFSAWFLNENISHVIFY